jgi:hypothetical protein
MLESDSKSTALSAELQAHHVQNQCLKRHPAPGQYPTLLLLLDPEVFHVINRICPKRGAQAFDLSMS